MSRKTNDMLRHTKTVLLLTGLICGVAVSAKTSAAAQEPGQPAMPLHAPRLAPVPEAVPALTLQDFERMALERHPLLAQAQARIVAARTRSPSTASIIGPGMLLLKPQTSNHISGKNSRRRCRQWR